MNDIDRLGPIPGLEIREKIGSGGMGAVYKAYQPSLDRLVALKIVQPQFLTAAGLDLFHREARSLARFSHPNIVQILEFHPEHAAPYFLMEYVDGIPLDQALRGRPWKEQALLFKEVVATIAVAHQHGVVHGDLKPANILVDRQLRPHILDFGLARLLRGEVVPPDETAGSAGTPAYLAPEVLGGQAPAGVTSDLFALGVTLYQILSGVLPFQTLGEVRAAHVRLPLEHNPDIPEPLQRICLKAMEQRPEDRYQTADQLLGDLERFGAGKPIFVRPTRYQQELEGRVNNHLAEINLWEKEGIISRREMDTLRKPYDQLLGQDSPWLSETRQVLTGPLLVRVGAWLLLTSALLWPVFYWNKLDQAERVASAGVPTGLMAVLAVVFLVSRNRRNALACVGSFVLLLLVFLVVLFSEFRWLEYPQRPEWELWGHRVQRTAQEQGGRAGTPALHGPDDTDEPNGPRDPGGPPPPPVLERVQQALKEHDAFILANSQLFAAVLIVTLGISFFFRALKARFFSPWLVVASVSLFSATLLLLGDKERLLTGRVAWVALHYAGLGLLLFLGGCWVEWRAAARVASPFYRVAIGVGLAAAVAVAGFGTEEWFGQAWTFDNEIWNVWLMCYAVPVFLFAWLCERHGSEGQRGLAWIFYLLVPLLIMLPLNLLSVDKGPTLGTLGKQPVHLYEVLYLLACIGLLVVGRLLNVEIFLVAGLWGLAIFVFRVTIRHLSEELSWPLAVGLLAAFLVGLGIWRSRRGDLAEAGTRTASQRGGSTGGTSVLQQETVTLPR